MSSKLNTVQKFCPKVTSVIDAKRSLIIDVIHKDALSSARKKHGECAMAEACKRKYKLDGVVIARSTAYLIKGNVATRYRVPPSVSREITSFDRGGGFEIGTYKLTKIRAIKIRKKLPPKTVKPSPSKFKHITTNIRSTLN